MYIRQETRRGVFRELRKELDWEGMGFGEEADQCSDAVSFEPPPCLMSAGSEGPPGRSNGALMSTTHCRGALRNFVRRHYASLSPKEQAKIYRRLQKRRRRCRQERQAALHADRDSGVRVVVRASAREVQS
jgi:hypothetical protein